MFCVECGSSDKEMIDNICIDCFLKDFQMITIPRNLEAKICSHCSSRLEEGKWIDSYLPEDEIIYRTLERNIEINDLVKNEEINLEIDQRKGTIANCYVEVIGEVYERLLEDTHDVDVKISKTVCPTCSKINAGYYECVIQFRADNREITEEEFDKAHEIVTKTLYKQSRVDKLAYCPKVAPLKEGCDYYVGSFKTGHKIVEALKEEFGGIIKESPRLISEDKSTGKGLYRVWISIRIPEFKSDDFIKYNDNIIQIKDIDKNRVSGINIKTHKKQNIPLKEMKKIEVLMKSEDIKTTNVISKSPHTLQILNPDDYTTVDLEMNKFYSFYEIGDKIRIIEIDNYFYVIT